MDIFISTNEEDYVTYCDWNLSGLNTQIINTNASSRGITRIIPRIYTRRNS